MGRHLFLVTLICGSITHQLKSQHKTITHFPLCALNTQIQSEKLNNFHKQLGELLTTFASKDSYKYVDIAGGTEVCNAAKWRGMALKNNIEQYFAGEYQISRDTVTLYFTLVNTMFIDKATKFQPIMGKADSLPQLVQIALTRLLTALQVPIDSTVQNKISTLAGIEQEQQTYIEAPAEIDPQTLINQNAKTAYDLGNYSLAAELFLTIEPQSAEFAEAQFYLGKCVLLQNDFHKAYLFFKSAQEAGYENALLSEYIYQVQHGNKPVEWYDNEAKRRQWWQSLSKDESLIILQMMNGLHINNNQYNAGYQFKDADIEKLLNTNVLLINDTRMSDLKLFKTFTKADVIIMENCKFDSGTGFNTFNKLRVLSVRKSNLLDLPEVNQFLSKTAVITVAN